jgi:uncharacterized protein DUF87
MTTPYRILTRTVPYDAAAHLKRIQTLYRSYNLNSHEKQERYVTLLVSDLPERYRDTFSSFLRSLLIQEGFFLNPHGPPMAADEITHRIYSEQETFLSHADANLEKITTVLVNFVGAFEDHLPDGDSGYTLSFTELLPDAKFFVERLFSHYPDKPFPRFREQFLRNVFDASGMDYDREYTESQLDRLVFPCLSDMPVAQMPYAYLRNTPLFGLFTMDVPFVIPRKTYAEHGALFAKSGHGKTQTLRSILASFLQEDDPPALFIMDSLGSLIEGLDQLDIFSTRLKDRLVIIDPTDAAPPALNFFKLQSDDLCFYLFKAIDQTFTPRQATMISYLMELMRNVPNATLLTLVEVCESKQNPYPAALQNLSPFAQSFFQNQFYAAKPDQLVQQTKSQIAQRIYTLGRLGKFTQMFSAPENKFDPFTCMQEKKVVLINTDARPAHLGGLGEASSILGRFILAQCLDAARSRPKHQRHLALLVVDEAKHYMDEQAALILSDARQFGLGLLLATQFPHQLADGVRREINTNTSIKMMGPVEYAVASQYARDMFTTPEAIMAVKSYDRSHAEWMTYVANLTDRAVKLSVPFGAIEKLPRMDQQTHRAMRAANMSKYGTLEATPKAQTGPVAPPTLAEDAQGRDPAPTTLPPTRRTPSAPRPDVPASPANPSSSEIKPGKKWIED